VPNELLCTMPSILTCSPFMLSFNMIARADAEELKQNKQLTEWTVRDLNIEPSLPYPDNTFDVVTNCVSVDYLTKPLEVRRSSVFQGHMNIASCVCPQHSQFMPLNKILIMPVLPSSVAHPDFQRDQEGTEARGHGLHELLQPVLPYKSYADLDFHIRP